MSYRWTSPRPLARVDGEDVAPGEEFEPTEAERKAFSGAIESVDEVADDNTDDADEAAWDTSDAPFDPGEYTVDELRDALADETYTTAELAALDALEREGKHRETALDAIGVEE